MLTVLVEELQCIMAVSSDTMLPFWSTYPSSSEPGDTCTDDGDFHSVEPWGGCDTDTVVS